ncbi:glycosyltransferase [Burkholderia stagnalis]
MIRHTCAAARSVAASTAFVLETNNLRGGAGMAQAVDSLKRLVSSLSRQTVPPAALAQWIITHDGLSADACAQIAALAGRPIDFVEIDERTGYYDAKNAGFDRVDAARCDIVVFGDADCRPADDWLEHLLAPFAREAGEAPIAVAGRTSYAPNVLGTALTSIDFMYFPSPLRDGATRNFYANNVAFRHAVFARYRYEPLDGVYRAHCQVMGLRMQAAGVAVEFAPCAHTEHRLPDTHRESLKLRWMRGEDSVGLTPYLVNAYLSRRWRWLGRSGPLGPLCVMAMRLGYSLRALDRQQLPRLGVVRYLAAVGVMLGASAIDMLGALARGAGLSGRAAVRRDLDALSYHRH